METTNKWPALVLRYWRGAASKPDKDELARERSISTMKDEQFRRVTSLRWMITRLRAMHSFDREASWNRVLAKAQDIPESIQLPKMMTQFNWLKAAACFVGALSVGAIIYLATSKITPGIVNDDIPALPNRARLLWHDRTSILLDEREDGILVQSGNTEVRKDRGIIYIKTFRYSKDTVQNMNELILPEGSHYKLSLPDSSLVTMTASSKIRFPTQFSSVIRRVEMDGLGFVQVAKNKKVPFEVKLQSGQIVRALGTSFIVQSYIDEKQSSVALVEGSVAISHQNKPKEKVLLKPLEKYISEGGKDTVVSNSNVGADVKALEDDQFNLGKDLRSILKDVSKWYGLNVSYPLHLNNPVLGGFAERQQSLSQLLAEIQKSAKLKISYTGNKIIVSQMP